MTKTELILLKAINRGPQTDLVFRNYRNYARYYSVWVDLLRENLIQQPGWLDPPRLTPRGKIVLRINEAVRKIEIFG